MLPPPPRTITIELIRGSGPIWGIMENSALLRFFISWTQGKISDTFCGPPRELDARCADNHVIIGLETPIVLLYGFRNSENSPMISIKSIVAVVALGTALVAAPAFATTHKAKPANTTTHKHSKVHTPSHKHVPVNHKSTKHAKPKAVHSGKNSAGKSHANAAGWKHHRSV